MLRHPCGLEILGHWLGVSKPWLEILNPRVDILAFFVSRRSKPCLGPLTTCLPPQVLGTAKNALVVWVGVALLGETVTLLQGVGYGISLGGFALYNYLKMQEPSPGPSPPLV